MSLAAYLWSLAEDARDNAVEQKALTRITRVRVIKWAPCAALAEQQLVNGGDLIALRTLLPVVAVVVLPGRAGLLQRAVDVDLDLVIGGSVLEVDRERDQMECARSRVAISVVLKVSPSTTRPGSVTSTKNTCTPSI